MVLEQTKIDPAVACAAVSQQRRYDVDWLRTLALGLLIIYHIVISFQPWAFTLYFPQNDQPLEGLWLLMAMINVWRIPILFLISGMGVRFAMERRDWKQLLKDRTLRILLPFAFGFFFITPIIPHVAIKIYGGETAYIPNQAHLWFLANIFAYVLLLLPLLTYLKKRPDNFLLRFLSKLFQHPAALLLLALPLMLEAWLVDPQIFTLYAGTLHGFLLGLICFFIGFLFISLKGGLWKAAEKIRWPALGLAFALYLVRLFAFELQDVNWLSALESMLWMLAILGYGSVYLNKPSAALSYLSKAVYPVYILHLPVQFIVAYYLLPLAWSPYLKLFVLTVGVFGVSLLLYEFVLRRINVLRPFFGMKLKSREVVNPKTSLA